MTQIGPQGLCISTAQWGNQICQVLSLGYNLKRVTVCACACRASEETLGEPVLIAETKLCGSKSATHLLSLCSLLCLYTAYTVYIFLTGVDWVITFHLTDTSKTVELGLNKKTTFLREDPPAVDSGCNMKARHTNKQIPLSLPKFSITALSVCSMNTVWTPNTRFKVEDLCYFSSKEPSVKLL